MTARILVVDDVPVNTLLLDAKLSAEYFQVTAAPDGLEALRLAECWQPDLILLDVMMPHLDGYETCRRLKANPRTLHIPVVMVTALGEPSERVLGLEAGADDFMTKPVEFDTLMARVRSLVRLKRLLDEWRARGETARALGLGADPIIPPCVGGAQALVVDDWDLGAKAILDALAQEGIAGTRARNAAEALAVSASDPLDLIVLSLSLAAEDPLRLASRLRAADATHATPLLLIAEPDQRDRILRGFDLGANDWLLRPMDENELRARARNQVRRKFYQDRLRTDLGHALDMALTDPLTGLYNRRYLLRHLESLLGGAQVADVAVLMLDVDYFKSVNDRFGHATGDLALRAIASMLRERTRAFDTLARYGGEEFVVVMPGADGEDAIVAAERLRAAAEQIDLGDYDQGRPTLTVSIGIACNHGQPMTTRQILSAADRALYAAKSSGRNRVEGAVAL